MDQIKKITMAFLNSAEGYFSTQQVLEKYWKQPRNTFGPMSDRPEKWDYTDIVDISVKDLQNILIFAERILDQNLVKIIKSTALHAALDYSIYTFDKGRFRSKIDSPTYNFLYNMLNLKVTQE